VAMPTPRDRRKYTGKGFREGKRANPGALKPKTLGCLFHYRDDHFPEMESQRQAAERKRESTEQKIYHRGTENKEFGNWIRPD
jgi:hypothetical protein